MEIVKAIRFKNMGTKVYADGKLVLNKDGSPKVTQDTVYIESLDLAIPYGQEADIPEEYTRPGRQMNGNRKPSPIEQLAPQLEPSDPDFKANWLKVPAEPTKSKAATPALSVEAFVRAGVPRGVAEQMMTVVQAARTAGG